MSNLRDVVLAIDNPVDEYLLDDYNETIERYQDNIIDEMSVEEGLMYNDDAALLLCVPANEAVPTHVADNIVYYLALLSPDGKPDIALASIDCEVDVCDAPVLLYHVLQIDGDTKYSPVQISYSYGNNNERCVVTPSSLIEAVARVALDHDSYQELIVGVIPRLYPEQ